MTSHNHSSCPSRFGQLYCSFGRFLSRAKRTRTLAAILAGVLLTVPALVHTTRTQANPNTWSSAASMSVGGSSHTATLLPNGKVLAAGGTSDLTSTLSSAELYDSKANTWSAAAYMAGARGIHTATLLSDGKVLVVGGWYMARPLASAELYDPDANRWSVAASMATPRAHHTATLLRNGKVLVTGGWNNGSTLASAELYAQLLTCGPRRRQ